MDKNLGLLFAQLCLTKALFIALIIGKRTGHVNELLCYIVKRMRDTANLNGNLLLYISQNEMRI